VTTAYKWGW